MLPAPARSKPIDRLLEIMRRLRDPDGGCPWDVAQDFATIAPYTIEEAYEVAEAIREGDVTALREELGDLLLQVVFHSQMAREAGQFDFDDVAATIADKMVRRHPHVFGAESGGDRPAPDWESQKAAERETKARDRGRRPSALDGVALGLPALTRAVKLQDRAGRVGFDWPEAAPVLDKIAEELGELRDEMAQRGPPARLAEEFGDLLFVQANLARHLGLDPETALRQANAKFARRFARIEALLAARGKRPEESDLAEMDALWDQVKAEEAAAGG